MQVRELNAALEANQRSESEWKRRADQTGREKEEEAVDRKNEQDRHGVEVQRLRLLLENERKQTAEMEARKQTAVGEGTRLR